MKFKYLKEVFGKKDRTIVVPGSILHKVEEILDQNLGEDDLVSQDHLIINFYFLYLPVCSDYHKFELFKSIWKHKIIV